MSGDPNETSIIQQCFELLSSAKNPVEDIRQRILMGDTYRAIAADHCVSFQRVAQIAQEMGVRRRVIDVRKREERRAPIHELVEEGYSIREIREVLPKVSRRDICEVRAKLTKDYITNAKELDLEEIHRRLNDGMSLYRACNNSSRLAAYVKENHPGIIPPKRGVGRPTHRFAASRTAIIELRRNQGLTWGEIAQELSKMEGETVNPIALCAWWHNYRRRKYGKTKS